MKWFRLILHLIEIWIYIVFINGIYMEYGGLISSPRFVLTLNASFDGVRIFTDVVILSLFLIRFIDILLYWIRGKALLLPINLLVFILLYALLITPDIYINLKWYFYTDLYLIRALFFASPILLWTIDYFLRRKNKTSAPTLQVD